MAGNYRKDSFLRYANTFDGFLDINNLPRIPLGEFDTEYKIKEAESGRPDLLANALYGNSRLWWIFALRNPDVIKDPIEDFKAGAVIKLPSPEVVKTFSG